MSEEADQNVANGAVLLDDQQPGWWKKINLDELQMSNCDRCIIGQVFGNYFYGTRKLAYKGIPLAGRCHIQERLGFEIGSAGVVGYSALNDAWARLITKRRAEAAKHN